MKKYFFGGIIMKIINEVVYYTKDDIAEICNVSTRTVTNKINELEEEEIIKKEDIQYKNNPKGKPTPLYNENLLRHIVSYILKISVSEVDDELFHIFLDKTIYPTFDYSLLEPVDNAINELRLKINYKHYYADDEFFRLIREINNLKEIIINQHHEINDLENRIEIVADDVRELPMINKKLEEENQWLSRLLEHNSINSDTMIEMNNHIKELLKRI